MGEVIPFPKQPSCFKCIHHAAGWDSITHCLLHDESIDSELYAARHCASYEPA
jgi:hypothetical protein